MATINLKNIGGLNLNVSPLLHKEGELIRSVNVETDLVGGKRKRSGYVTYLGTPDNDQVNTLFDWHRNDGTTFWNYRASGSILYYSTQGTGDWTVCGNGTIGAGAHVGQAVLEDTLIIGDGTTATRHTTNGTSFTNTSAAPIAPQFTDFQNRIHAIGTASFEFFSTTGTPSDWTSDSTSLTIPGPGKLLQVLKSPDRITFTKNSGGMFRYDGDTLVDLATKLGPSSPYSVAEVEGFRFWLNRLGIFGYNGDIPDLVSNPIEKQIYNDANGGIAGTVFDTAPGVVHRYDYLLSVGTITDDLTNETLEDAIIKYDYQLSQFSNYKFNNFPTAWHSFKNNSQEQQLIFGGTSGQCFTMAGTATTDNGNTIASVIEMVLHGGTLLDKKWNWLRLVFNPGCQAQVQIAASDTFVKGKKDYKNIGDAQSGVIEHRFPTGSQSKFLFLRMIEASKNTRFEFYGGEVDADVIPSK